MRGCGQEKGRIGQDVSHVLEYVPAHFVEHEYRLKKWACRSCKRGVTTAPGPTKVIDRSGDGASVLAHAVVSKYADHTPCTDFQSIVAPGHLQKPPIDAPRDAVCM